MRWSDILTPQRSDMGLLSAPGYVPGRLYGFRTYSYMGLLHVASFTDVLDIFQAPAAPVPTNWSHRTQLPFARQRSPASQELQEASVCMGLAFSALAGAGTLACLALGGVSLLTGRGRIEDSTLVIAALAAGFYSTIFLSLHRLGDPYTPGFWLPRLVLPALLVFFCLGFVALDLALRRTGGPERWKTAAERVALGYTLAACLVFAGFLA
jgi:hypothetical protein